MQGSGLTRREGLGLAALAAGAVAAPALGAVKIARPLVTKIDFKDPAWNRDTYARIDGTVEVGGPGKLSWMKGIAYGVRDNEPVRPLFGWEGFSYIRNVALPNDDWQRLCREVVFYRDLKTGAILETWRNPYTDEDVKVVPIANDPFNMRLSTTYPEPPSYGGLQTMKRDPRPYLLDWTTGPNDTLVLRTGIDMIYPAALQPDQWPRESAGPWNRVSEHFHYTVARKDVENPALPYIPQTGSWHRVTSWLPWMLMGQAPGNISYFGNFAASAKLADLPADLIAAARAMGDKWFSAPTEDIGPSLSSLENYRLTQKPAAVPAGWAPPQPPPLRPLPMRPKAG